MIFTVVRRFAAEDDNLSLLQSVFEKLLVRH